MTGEGVGDDWGLGCDEFPGDFVCGFRGWIYIPPFALRRMGHPGIRGASGEMRGFLDSLRSLGMTRC